MRRLFIIRKDLHLSAGKLAAMIGHCCEAYWTNILKNCAKNGNSDIVFGTKQIVVDIDADIWNNYVNGIFTKTICECRNRNQLMKAVQFAEENFLHEGIDYGLINDKCLTELTPENPDGTTTVGIWFKPMKDDFVRMISKKYKLYRSERENDGRQDN